MSTRNAQVYYTLRMPKDAYLQFLNDTERVKTYRDKNSKKNFNLDDYVVSRTNDVEKKDTNVLEEIMKTLNNRLKYCKTSELAQLVSLVNSLKNFNNDEEEIPLPPKRFQDTFSN